MYPRTLEDGGSQPKLWPGVCCLKRASGATQRFPCSDRLVWGRAASLMDCFVVVWYSLLAPMVIVVGQSTPAGDLVHSADS